MNPEIQQLEDILDAILQAVQEVLQSGEAIPEDLQNLIAQEITALTQDIEALSGNPVEGLQETPRQPEVNPAQFPSSNINGFKYDPKTQRLLVKFQGKYPQQNGPVYSYEGVQPFIYKTFAQGAVPPKTSGSNKWHTWQKGVTPSLGAAMYHLIRTNYPYQRVA